MNNLIKNAKQAVSDTQTPRMRVCLKKVDGTAEIIVEDNGSGIADDFKDKIFRPNFTTKSSGMGLGLSICKQIIESAGGSISFESELGIGTTFKVTLPAVKP